VDVDRKQNLAVPQVAADVVSKLSNFTDRSLYRAQGLLDTPSVQYQDDRVQAMFKRLIAQVDVIHPEASTWDWEIHVVDRGRVNAYTVGAGKVMVYRGLIEHLALTEDELAFILAGDRELGLERLEDDDFRKRLAEGAAVLRGEFGGQRDVPLIGGGKVAEQVDLVVADLDAEVLGLRLHLHHRGR
jgi:hypothetical protein